MDVMSRPQRLSGFPEWLPAEKIVESAIIASLQHTFALHAFTEIETRAVEPLDQLLRKGETSKEVYVLRRLQESVEEAAAEAQDQRQLGLHFDLTVPFARYVLENAGKLVFPFRRFQIQKVWRGERPQEGRFREFIQADIDVVAQDMLPAHYEVELPLVMAEALNNLTQFGVPKAQILVNNRRLSEGFYRSLGISDVDGVLRNIDKLDKIGASAVRELLESELALTAESAQACLDLAAINATEAADLQDQVLALCERVGASHELLDQGLAELTQLLDAASARLPEAIKADLKIARGLDYYTGAVYETVLVGHEDLGSVCSGGRYDTLASDGKTTYPGVGLSIGVSRLVSRLIAKSLAVASRSVPTAVLVAVNDEADRATSNDIAATLRANGTPVEVAPTAAKFGKQIRYAERRGIPYVWFPPTAERTRPDGSIAPAQDHQIKDIRSGEQRDADPSRWTPPIEDLWPSISAGV